MKRKGRPKIMDDLQYWSEKLKNAVILEPEEPISKKFHLFLSGYVEKSKVKERKKYLGLLPEVFLTFQKMLKNLQKE